MSNQVAQFVAGLKSRNVELQIKTARELYHYAKTELREVPQDELTQFLDEFNHQIFEMVSSSDVHERKGGVLAIVCLIGGDCDTTKTRITRFANYLRNLLPSSDVGVMELAAKTVGRLATVSGVKRAEYVEFEVKRAFEWLSEERNEGRRHSAVLLLKEMAIAMPTYFYQQVSGFFDHILVALKDPKPQIREAAAKALRAGFVVTTQRETAKQSTAKPQWYMQCYEEAMLSFEEIPTKEKGITKEDRVHGGLLILNELLRCSNAVWEKKYTTLMQSLDTQKDIAMSDDIIFISTKLHSPSVKRGYLCDGFKTENVTYPVSIYESAVCRALLTEKFEKICHDVMAQRLLKAQGVPQVLLIIIPRLAAFNKEYFLRKYISSTMNYLLSSLRSRERDRNMAFTTIGLVAAAIDDEIKTYIPRIMDVIKQALPVRDTQSKKRIYIDPSIFACIALLGSAVKDLVVNDIRELLDAMFATGLSPSLTICLKELSENLPVLRGEISEGLLNMLSLVLRNKPFLHPGMPRSLEQQMSSMSMASEPQDTGSTVLALRTLGTFQFEGQHSLLTFVRRCADHFLQSDQQEIRLEAVKTAAKLLADATVRTMKTPSKTLTILTAEVVGKLLVVSVTDPDYEVRYWVLKSLNEIFDSHLAQIENLSFLFIAMNDEHLEIRELAICSVGRLSTVNPAYVMPGLRKTLIQFLTELEHSGMSRNKEQAARMLDNLIRHAPRLVRPYMETILNVLVPKLKESEANPGVVISVLKAIGDLADVNGDNSGLKKCLPEILSILLELLSDASATDKRSIALWAFGQLISATGYVVIPYTEYPNLMDVLLNFLKTEQQPKDRRETIRVLGLLGALDPYKHKLTRGLINGQPDSSLVPVADSKADENNFDMTTSEMLVNMSSPVLDEYYPAIVISTLMRILRDPTLQQHHTSVVQAVTFIFESLGIKCVPYISRVMPSLLYVARASDTNFREFLFTQLARLIAIVKQHIRNYLDKIFDLIKEFWTPNSSLQPTLILLVEHIAVALGSEFKVYLPQLMPQILRVLAHDTSKNRMVTEKLLFALQKFEDNLDDYMHLVIPSIVKLFDASDCPISVAKVAMETVDYLSDSLNYSELISRIIHPLVRSMDSCAPLRPTAMDTLCALIVQLGRKYMDFIPLVQKIVTKHRIQHQNYELLMAKLQTNPSLAVDDFLQSTRRKPRNNNQEARIVVCDTSSTIRKLYVNAHNLKLAYTVSSRVSKDDWLEWLRRFSIGLLTESHSPALRACLALAHNYSQLLRDLFNAAFVSCWTELEEGPRGALQLALEQALTAPDAPELAHTVLNLAEFMEHCEAGALPISTQLLGERAMRCRAYAKALHYKVWTELEGPRGALQLALEQALTAPDAPELAHTVLNLAEFMEHCEAGALPISTQLLGERAMRCRAYAKALHYKVWTELEGPRGALQLALEQALTAPDAPELAHTVLNLAEFMEHCEAGALPISTQLLGERAMRCRAYAKPLHYKVWTELEGPRGALQLALEQALTAPDAPELAHTVLNLAEFMEHCEAGALPISTQLLGERAMRCRAYAKALHYKEEEFRSGATSQVVEALIHINNKLQQKEAAEGLLERVMAQREAGDTSLQVQVRWYEKLHNWEKALNLYGDKLVHDPADMEAYLGSLRCFEALGEWVKLYNTVSKRWPQMTNDEKFKAARLAAAAAWGLNEWDSMAKYVSFLPENTQDGAFYRAVLSIHNGEFKVSRQFIDQARTLLDSELTAVAGESYQRAYGALVNAQLLAELEEVITYKLISERRDTIRQAWWTRLQGGQRLVEDWRKILQVRGLVLTPHEDMATWLKFASLCRKSGAPRQAHRTLVMLLGTDPSENTAMPLPTHEPRLTLAYAKHLWVAGDKQLAYDQLQRYVESAETGDPEHCRLTARCHLKLGAWCESLLGINETSIPEILRNYSSATVLSPDWYKAWHAWAYMNFESVLFHKHQEPKPENAQNVDPEFVQQYTVPAVDGFFKSINLSHGSSLQDTLRLLTLWFDYGHHPAVHEALVEGIRTIEINVWLQVIPQLIARIDTPRALVGKLIHSLLIDIGKSHPQALVYPLTVASKSSFVARKNAANQILKSMCTHSSDLVNQAAMISEELIRVAILWHEQWHEALEEASRLYFSEHDDKAMFKTLEPLHAMLERGPQTMKEVSFSQAYGRDLNEAQGWCNRYNETHATRDLNQAWDLYYHVFRRISRQLPQLTSLELQYVSPRLLNCRDLQLAVPGSYVPDQPLIRIAHIQSSLQVITSKQRPRRLCVRGSNGKDYMFLLKGHEDLRQDERVMQLFGLVNTLLQADPDTFRRDLAIQRYAVIPLSTNSGLIGWVPHCDTLHSLIRDYREKRKCLLNIEHRIMQRMASDLEKLMLMQKVEVFEHALEHTAGDDLAKLLWLKSPSSEVWFERRTNYTRSLAVMSMVGYILGLGDRHPSNIMLDRVTGKFLHIDFGDCFEVAVTRDKFPEKIPFRLTRMLINAMEVTGIEGTYRRTCESVMEVLHRHKDSVMAVLEAFVYDPLLNWRLIEAGRRSRADPDAAAAEPGSPLPSRTRVPAAPYETLEPETNLNMRALGIVNRVRDKLTGRDFPHIDEIVTVQKQVELLIQQATSNENLCQCYVGWCPFW